MYFSDFNQAPSRCNNVDLANTNATTPAIHSNRKLNYPANISPLDGVSVAAKSNSNGLPAEPSNSRLVNCSSKVYSLITVNIKYSIRRG